jgi:hypothetical protein
MKNIFIYGDNLDILIQRNLTKEFGTCHVIDSISPLKLSQIANTLPSDQIIIIIDKECFADEEGIATAVKLLATKTHLSFLYAPTPEDNIAHASNIAQIAIKLKNDCCFPFGGIAFPIAMLDAIPTEANQNLRLITLFLFCYAILDKLAHSLIPNTIPNVENKFLLSNFEKTSTMLELIRISNIEELFDNSDWKNITEIPIKAAACYRELAAFFLHYGDHESALDCVNLSDSLHESPRSNVLRAIIATMKGDTLTAVANIVSSLQQYEENMLTNKQTKSLTSEIEVELTGTMQQGLKALNQKDNHKAYNYFARAVSQYDDFFSRPELISLLASKE